jgi:Zn finger protein HypA/HybF involved in hydrogenase expression
MICKHCPKEISRNSKTGLCPECWHKEQSNLIYKDYIDKWKKGLVDGLRGSSTISAQIRKYLFEKYHSKCTRCGWGEINPYTNKVPLDVEHLDGNYQNNKEENLILLCPNCHSLTETYKGVNRGNGRPFRAAYKNKGSSTVPANRTVPKTV